MEEKGQPLYTAEHGKNYTVSAIEIGDAELEQFLFTLGCFVGEPIVLVSTLNKTMWSASRTGATRWTGTWRKPSLSPNKHD